MLSLFFKKRNGVLTKKRTKINVQFFVQEWKIIFQKTQKMVLKHNAAIMDFYILERLHTFLLKISISGIFWHFFASIYYIFRKHFMPENAKLYECEKCNFKCSKKSNWDKHLLTRKHNMEAKMPENAESYECIKCNFKCSKKSNWDKH